MWTPCARTLDCVGKRCVQQWSNNVFGGPSSDAPHRLNEWGSSVKLGTAEWATGMFSICLWYQFSFSRAVITKLTQQHLSFSTHLLIWSWKRLLASVQRTFSPPSPSISVVALVIFLLQLSASSSRVCFSEMAASYMAWTTSSSFCFSSSWSWASVKEALALFRRASWMVKLAWRRKQKRNDWCSKITFGITLTGTLFFAFDAKKALSIAINSRGGLAPAPGWKRPRGRPRSSWAQQLGRPSEINHMWHEAVGCGHRRSDPYCLCGRLIDWGSVALVYYSSLHLDTSRNLVFSAV